MSAWQKIFRHRLAQMSYESREMRDYSSDAANFANTLKSSSVVVSPVTFAPLAISLRRRRMILPLRVWKGFGKAHFVRLCNCADVRADVIAQFLFESTINFNSTFHRHKRDNPLTL